MYFESVLPFLRAGYRVTRKSWGDKSFLHAEHFYNEKIIEEVYVLFLTTEEGTTEEFTVKDLDLFAKDWRTL